jgi:hypothetical protein
MCSDGEDHYADRLLTPAAVGRRRRRREILDAAPGRFLPDEERADLAAVEV